jgi:hypothetical protein
MAYITNIAPDFNIAPLFNLESTVGRTGKNLPSDVYLMQILFTEVSKGTSWKYNFTNFSYSNELEAALQDYKRLSNEWATKRKDPSMKVYYEGHIDPAKGSSRAFGSNRKWSICKLNDIMRKRVISSGYEGDIVDYIYNFYPLTRAVFSDKRSGIGGMISKALEGLQSSLVFDVFRSSIK